MHISLIINLLIWEVFTHGHIVRLNRQTYERSIFQSDFAVPCQII
jgi:hypothetical protein